MIEWINLINQLKTIRKRMIQKCMNIQKIATGQGDDCKTGC